MISVLHLCTLNVGPHTSHPDESPQRTQTDPNRNSTSFWNSNKPSLFFNRILNSSFFFGRGKKTASPTAVQIVLQRRGLETTYVPVSAGGKGERDTSQHRR